MDNSEHQKNCICAWCEVERQNAEIRRDRAASARRSAAACSPSSDTPVTDAAEGYHNANGEWKRGVPWALTEAWVPAKVSRELERKLNAAWDALKIAKEEFERRDGAGTSPEEVENAVNSIPENDKGLATQPAPQMPEKHK